MEEETKKRDEEKERKEKLKKKFDRAEKEWKQYEEQNYEKASEFSRAGSDDEKDGNLSGFE